MILLVLLLVFITNTDGCIRSKDAEYVHASSVVRITCPRDIIRTADRRSTSATVSWGENDFRFESKHPIEAVYQTVPIYGASVAVTKTFSEGSHHVEYKAIDEGGVIGSCSFFVTISVIRCDRLYNPNPHVGRLTCDAGNVYGSSCSLSCYEGYKVIGSSTIECEEEGDWSGDIPFCQITTCPDPGTPIHGTRFCTTVNHAYGSFCTFACNHGFQLVGKDKLFCGSNTRDTYWSAETPFCEEIKPPRVEICPPDTVITTSETVTEIQKPRILFRTADGSEAPYTCSHFGEDNKHNFTLGIHVVNCTAFDPKFGNKATANCFFTIQIKANPCRPLNKPQNGALLCSRAHGGGTASHDTSCKLHCDNGYTLGRDAVNRGSMFVCDNSGQWLPSNTVPSCVRPKRPHEITLPSEILYNSSDCTNPDHLKIVELKFQSAVQRAIRLPGSGVCATNPGNCIVEEVNSHCMDDNTAISEARFRRFTARLSHRRHLAKGRSPQRQSRSHRQSLRRRQRSASPYLLSILFHFGTRVPGTSGTWPDEYHNAKRRLLGMFDTFETQLLAGNFSITSKVTGLDVVEQRDSLTYHTEIAICDIGYSFVRRIKLCVPCGAGTHYDIDQERCVHCRPGQYQNQEAQFSCTPCPAGSSTLEAGATSISQCVAIDECLSNPCLHNGVCQDGNSTYNCKCQPGYAGPNCELPVYDCSVHACQSGGTCLPDGQHNYTCQCRPHYFGEYCQQHTVDGGWSDWSDWSPCSASCEGGVTSRNRSCDSPPPSESGEDCEGPALEEKVCNLHECPACKRLRRPYRGTIHCERYDDIDYQSCAISCPQGLDFSGPVYPVYNCGWNTSYLWPHETPDNPRCVLPACTKVVAPSEVRYEFQSSLELPCTSSTDISDILLEKIQDKARDMTMSLRCIQDNTCSLETPVVSCCEPQKRSRRQEGSWDWHQVGITDCNPQQRMHIRIRRDTEHYKNDTALTNNTEDDNLLSTHDDDSLGSVELKVVLLYHTKDDRKHTHHARIQPEDNYNATTEELETLGHDLLNKTSHGELFVEYRGRRVRTYHTQAANSAVCPSGSMQSNYGYNCVECSPGTFYNKQHLTCALCEVGSYQSLAGQTTCHQCPHNQTTYGRGAILRAECYNQGTTPPDIPDDKYEQLELSLGDSALYHILPISVITVLVAITCFIIIVVIVRRKHQTYVHRKPHEGSADGTEDDQSV